MLQKLWLSFKTKEVSLIKYVNQQHEKVPRGEKGKLPPGGAGGEEIFFCLQEIPGFINSRKYGPKRAALGKI